MLKITVTESATEMRWTLHGRLLGPWVGELRQHWEAASRTRGERTCVVDLNNVTFIDKGGEMLLRAMAKRGTRFTASGVHIKHLLERLKTRKVLRQ